MYLKIVYKKNHYFFFINQAKFSYREQINISSAVAKLPIELIDKVDNYK